MIPTAATPNITLTDEQQTAVRMVQSDARFFILTGGPGTGKTTTVNRILDWIESQHLTVAMCAPTGKAAKRMMETTGRKAFTIHSLLAATMNNGEFIFQVNEKTPLSENFVIVDEVSMVPNALMADLMRAINPDTTKVLLVGDEGQLPSVGAGAILRDLLASSVVPFVRLTHIHRNSGEIVRACHLIHQGKSYAPCTQLDVEAGFNLRHIETSSPTAIQDVILQLLPKMRDRGFDPIWDVQVLSPTNKRSDLSCDGLNNILQSQLNSADAIDGSVFRKDDKVIQTKNVKINDVSGKPTFIVNGDMGRIIQVDADQSKMKIRFQDPERTVLISKKQNNLLRAYCITCHRAQGSEAPVVIIPVHKTFRFILTRNWIYTAISRARVMCFTVGQFSAITAAIGREEMGARTTRLAEKLVNEIILQEGI